MRVFAGRYQRFLKAKCHPATREKPINFRTNKNEHGMPKQLVDGIVGESALAF